MDILKNPLPDPVALFPGVTLYGLSNRVCGATLPPNRGIHIYHCRTGRMDWPGSAEYSLTPGQFLIRREETGMVCPTDGVYQGILLAVDLHRLHQEPPELLSGMDLAQDILSGTADGVVFSENSRTRALFAPFYRENSPLFLAQKRVKAMELLLFLAEGVLSAQPVPDAQQQIMGEIHQYLLENIHRHITIEELSRQFHMNPTTLKSAFKSVYGTSLAAHIKHHRMGRAGYLLLETDMPIAQIAQTVGYDSQGKFTAAFKSAFGVLPRDFRKQPCGDCTLLCDGDCLLK